MSNPNRGCGKKKENSFYVEGEIRPGGGLSPITWILGDGIENVMPMQIPARKQLFCSIPGSIAKGELVLLEGRYEPTEWEAAIYRPMLKKIPAIGIVDHVGKNHYSAKSFADELAMYGPSRKIPPAMAKQIGEVMHKHGPLPIMFTHSRMPVFTDSRQADDAIAVARSCYNFDTNDLAHQPVWEYPNWGLYAEYENWNGSFHPQHYYIPLLRIIHELDRNWRSHMKNDAYKSAKNSFAEIRMVEQPFAVSWLTKVTYTLPKDGNISQEAMNILSNIPNVQILDLNENEEEEHEQ